MGWRALVYRRLDALLCKEIEPKVSTFRLLIGLPLRSRSHRQGRFRMKESLIQKYLYEKNIFSSILYFDLNIQC